MTNIPTVEFSEISPNGFDSRSLGGSRLRELKKQFREILAADHIASSSGSGADWGYHNKLSFTDYGTTYGVASAFVLYAKVVSGKTELHFVDEDDNEIQVTSGGSFSGGMIGEVRMFKGLLTEIPTGWALCDGSGSTPNLIAKFIRGIATDSTEPGDTGGSDTVTLSIDNLPGDLGEHAHVWSGKSYPGGVLGLFGGKTTGGVGVSVAASNQGDDTPFTCLPTYCELAFIMRV